MNSSKPASQQLFKVAKAKLGLESSKEVGCAGGGGEAKGRGSIT